MKKPLGIGLVLPNLGPLATAESMIAIAERAEARGFADLWTADHVVLPIESDTSYPYVRDAKVRLDPTHPIIDPMIALAGLATRTRTIGLGISVYLAALRHPLVAARLVASLDHLSGGRVRLGVGAGWIPEEYETMGIPFAERGRVLDEHLAALRTLFSDTAPRFEGEHYRFDNLGFEPKPVQSPLPIWIGGNSPPARRRAVTLGDAWHVIDLPVETLDRGVRDLRARCEKAGRDPTEIVVSMRAQVVLSEAPIPEKERFAPLMGPRDFVLEEIGRLRQAGLDHIALWPARAGSDVGAYLESVDRFAEEIVPAFAPETGA
ncbi:MAG: LLM class F420-dependent oxidoreductase [bacterium]|nr:LLM class F420-dependent oxidoreductase [bacterium]